MLYKKYSKYKDSGIEWLGEIPEHWEVVKGKFLFIAGMGNTILKEDLNDNGKYPVYSATENDEIFGYVNKPSLILNKGDFVIPARGNSIGHIKMIKTTSTATQTTIYCKILNRNKLFPKYIFYYMKGNKKYLFNFTQTAIPQITVKEILENYILTPPLSEQKAIASFLDREIEKIDTLIKKEEELIKLLEEKKEALITKAVTKGLKNTKMKESSIEWLGEIPEYWEIRRLKHVVKIINGSTPSSKIKEYWNGNIIWITPQDFGKNKYLQNSKRKITKLGLLNCGTEIVPKNSIILTTRAPIGNVAIAKHSLCTNQGCKSLIPLKITSNYLYYYFVSISSVLNALGIGTTFKELNTESLKNLSIPLPPLQEQKQIAEYLDKKLSQIDKLIKKSKKAIELLKEKKESLITNAVTGKIDVRNFDEA